MQMLATVCSGRENISISGPCRMGPAPILRLPQAKTVPGEEHSLSSTGSYPVPMLLSCEQPDLNETEQEWARQFTATPFPKDGHDLQMSQAPPSLGNLSFGIGMGSTDLFQFINQWAINNHWVLYLHRVVKWQGERVKRTVLQHDAMEWFTLPTLPEAATL